MINASTPYDQVEYHAGTFAKTHPQRLASVAHLFGLNSPPIERCRVLELGCGDGANLIPMAFHMPDSQFVGIDLAQIPIQAGLRRVQRLRLSNIQLRQGDVAQLNHELGKFDYIIAHGLYSWVPDVVRPHILRVANELLTENGLAYISYNALPGCRLRHLVRELLQFRFGKSAFNPSRLRDVREFLQEFARIENASHNEFQLALRGEIDFIQKIPDFVLFHDDLAEHSNAFYLHEFLAQAKEHHLQYLGEASIHEMFTLAGDESFDSVLSRWSNDDWIAREQYLDFTKGTRFRQTVLCRSSQPLDRQVGPNSLLRFELRSALVTTASDHLLYTHEPMTFGGMNRTIELTEPIAKLAIKLLGDHYPNTIRCETLFAQALSACQRCGQAYDERTAHAATLKLLWALIRADQIELLRDSIKVAPTSRDRPKITALVADAIKHGDHLCGALHRRFDLDDQLGRELALAMDGTKSQSQLCETFRASGSDPSGKAEHVDKKVAGLIAFLRRQGALAGEPI
jgi:SAM-dependent methyltransferase